MSDEMYLQMSQRDVGRSENVEIRLSKRSIATFKELMTRIVWPGLLNDMRFPVEVVQMMSSTGVSEGCSRTLSLSYLSPLSQATWKGI